MTVSAGSESGPVSDSLSSRQPNVTSNSAPRITTVERGEFRVIKLPQWGLGEASTVSCIHSVKQRSSGFFGVSVAGSGAGHMHGQSGDNVPSGYGNLGV